MNEIYLIIEDDFDLEKARKDSRDEDFESGAIITSSIRPSSCMKVVDLTEDGQLCIDGEVEEFGNIHIDIDMDLDLVVKIIQHYQKKLNKLKSVLESVK